MSICKLGASPFKARAACLLSEEGGGAPRRGRHSTILLSPPNASAQCSGTLMVRQSTPKSGSQEPDSWEQLPFFLGSLQWKGGAEPGASGSASLQLYVTITTYIHNHNHKYSCTCTHVPTNEANDKYRCVSSCPLTAPKTASCSPMRGSRASHSDLAGWRLGPLLVSRSLQVGSGRLMRPMQCYGRLVHSICMEHAPNGGCVQEL